MNTAKSVIKYGFRKTVTRQEARCILKPLLSKEDWAGNKKEIFNFNAEYIEALRVFILCGINIKTSIEIIPHLENYMLSYTPLNVSEASKAIASVINGLNLDNGLFK